MKYHNMSIDSRYCRRAALKRMTRDIKEDADEERRIKANKSDGMDNVFLGNNRQALQLASCTIDLFYSRAIRHHAMMMVAHR